MRYPSCALIEDTPCCKTQRPSLTAVSTSSRHSRCTVSIQPRGLHRIQQLHKHYTGDLFSLCNSLWHNRVLTECTLLVNSMTDAFLYFGYGSNLLKQRLQLLNPSAEFVTIGKLKVSTVRLVKYVYAFDVHYCAVVLLPIPNDPGNAFAHILQGCFTWTDAIVLLQ